MNNKILFINFFLNHRHKHIISFFYYFILFFFIYFFFPQDIKPFFYFSFYSKSLKLYMYILNENKLKGVTRTPRHVLKKLNLLKKSLFFFFFFFFFVFKNGIVYISRNCENCDISYKPQNLNLFYQIFELYTIFIFSKENAIS